MRTILSLPVERGSLPRLSIPAVLAATFAASALTGCSDGSTWEPTPTTATVSGMVREAGTEAPVGGAMVRVGSAVTSTDEDGRFEVSDVPVGPALAMSVTKNGFETHTRTIAVKEQSNDQLILLVRNHIYVSGLTDAYLPPDVSHFRGALFVLPGSNGDTRPITTDQRGGVYRQLAEQHSLALVGTSNGVGVQLTALEAIAEESGRPELGTAPLLLAGYSEGACFAFTAALESPDRVIAVLVLKAAWYQCPGDHDGQSLQHAPLYILVGEFEPRQVPTTLFEENRAEGAVWALAIHKGKGHEGPTTEDDGWIRDWLDGVLTLRLPASDPPGTPTTLRPIPESSGWLGDRASFAIAPYDCYDRNRREASWLPTERSARGWQAIVSDWGVGTVIDC